MGLFSIGKKLFKRSIKAAKPFIPAAAGIVGGATAQQLAQDVLGGNQIPALARPTGGLPALRGLPPGAGTTPAILTRKIPPGQRQAIIAAGGGCPQGFHPAKDGSGRCVRNRRMNVMNPRAARRAIRRIKGARKMLQSIERQLPKQRTRSRPVRHRRELIHD